MRPSTRDRQALAAIADELAASDQELASRLALFTRLTVGEAMPVRESRARARGRDARTAGTRHPPGATGSQPGGWRGTLLMVLWVLISVILIAVASVVSRGDPSPCTVPGAAGCAAHHVPRSR
jgi:hypothetical protein